MKRTKTKRKTINRRVDVAPEGGLLAELGYYTAPVQSVVRKWKPDKLRQEWIEGYFQAVAMPVVCQSEATTIRVG